MPATIRGTNIFFPIQGLTGLNHEYNHEDTPEPSQEVPAIQDATSENSEDDATKDTSQVSSIDDSSCCRVYCVFNILILYLAYRRYS